jgi:hypothetical protein
MEVLGFRLVAWCGRERKYQCVVFSVAELKLFWLQLRLRLWLQLCNVPVCTALKLRSRFFMIFFIGKNIDLIHLLNPIQYEWWFFLYTIVWPEARAVSRSRNFNIPAPVPAPQHWFCSHHSCYDFFLWKSRTECWAAEVGGEAGLLVPLEQYIEGPLRQIEAARKALHSPSLNARKRFV